MRSVAFGFVLSLALCACSSPVIKQRAPVQVLTALPLFWGEGEFGAVLKGETGQSALVTALEKDGPLRAIERADGNSLDPKSILLLIQPPALAPEELVAIDRHVRDGGRVVVLADPELSWEQGAPIGSRSRAPAQSMLAPLYEHWGLMLNADKTGDVIVDTVFFAQGAGLLTPGRWSFQGKGSFEGKGCVLTSDNRLADCHIGKGRVILIADADFVNPALWPDAEDDNLSALRVVLGEVSQIEAGPIPKDTK